MAKVDDDSKFYWIKIRTDFFAENTPIDFLLSRKPNGAEYVALYLKLCLATANSDGRFVHQFGEIIVPYDIEKITADMKYFSIDTVRVALNLYKQLGLIYEEADGTLAISKFSSMVGSESASKEAVKKREYRAKVKEKQLVDNAGTFEGTFEWTDEGTEEGTNCPTEIRDKRLEIRDKRLEIRDKSKEIEEQPAKQAAPFARIVDAFNSICKSYPQVKSLSEARKKAIKARLNTYSEADFIRVFEKAEASDFLKGKNERNWSATFDWLIKDSSMPKVLEGNFDNKETSKPKTQMDEHKEYLQRLLDAGK